MVFRVLGILFVGLAAMLIFRQVIQSSGQCRVIRESGSKITSCLNGAVEYYGTGFLSTWAVKSVDLAELVKEKD